MAVDLYNSCRSVAAALTRLMQSFAAPLVLRSGLRLGSKFRVVLGSALVEIEVVKVEM